MCDICKKAKSSSTYLSLISQMIQKDMSTIENTKEIAKEMPILNELNYVSVKWPVKMFYPLFEARNAFAVPNNYFQPLMINGGKAGVFFSHNSTRSVFFSKDRLIVYSKTMNHKKGKDYFTSFLFAHFDKGEYFYGMDKGSFYLKASKTKKLKNLITGKQEEKKISFNFVQKPIENCIVSKKEAAASTQLKRIYGQYSSVTQKLASSDLEGHVVTVPHFSPHPYMLQLHKEFGFKDNKDFQLHVMDYFRNHLNL